MAANLFIQVKASLNIVDVAERYGLTLRRGKCCCPFHTEKTASFSVSARKQWFKCFGCGASGDAITLAAKLLGLNPMEALKRLNEDFGLGMELDKPSPKKAAQAAHKRQQEQRDARAYTVAESAVHTLLAGKLRNLKRYRLIHSPMLFGDPWSPRFAATGDIPYLEYLLDLLENGDEMTRALVVADALGGEVSGVAVNG